MIPRIRYTTESTSRLNIALYQGCLQFFKLLTEGIHVMKARESVKGNVEQTRDGARE
jgi:hypothetical protein